MRAREVPATIPSHSSFVEPLRDELLELLEPIAPRSGEIPFYSTVTGELLDTRELDAEYWYRNLRQPVRFEPVVRGLLEGGRRLFVEVSSHPVFALAVGETIESALGDPDGAAVVGTLRRDEGGPERFMLSLAEAHSHGAAVEWGNVFAGVEATRVDLPTYPFQGRRYWLEPDGARSDPHSVGQSSVEHPLLGALIDDPDGDELIFTGRLSLAAHPWLADHAIGDTPLLPGTAFLELALWVGEQAGTPVVEELTVNAPIPLPDQGAVALRVKVAAAGEDGRREISIHSRTEAEGAEWVQNATGFLDSRSPALPEPLRAWPPADAEQLEPEFLYDRLAEVGLDYGPAFQGLHAAWRSGEEIYADVSLPAEQVESAKRFAIHPALSDAALHAFAFAFAAGSSEELQLPFAWRGVELQSTGAAHLRARLVPTDAGVSVSLFDLGGAPLGTIESLALRPLDPALLRGGGGPGVGLLEVEWRELATAEAAPAPEGEELTPSTEAGAATVPALWRLQTGSGGDRADAALVASRDALQRVQEWLKEAGGGDDRLAIVTQGGQAVWEGESADPAAAAVWGLVRVAQTEHPGRLVLLDVDGSEASEEAIGAALAIGEEPQLALREGSVLVPRLARIGTADPGGFDLDAEKTVLVTGATGGLGSLIARHLVEKHGARHLLLASRSGEAAEGAAELMAELEQLGAEAELCACDVSERSQLEAILSRLPQAHPLGAVIHAAGALEDATIESLEPSQLEPVLAPKASAAWHLHELTEEAELSAFVLYSAAAGVLGSPGQANYAAANSFLDGLATYRQARGLPATSIVWGLWERAGAGPSSPGEADRARISRAGAAALADAQGLELFDLALGDERPAPLALALDLRGLKARAAAGLLPPLLSGLVQGAARRASGGPSLASRLAALSEAKREELVLDLVRAEVASVLGHESGDRIEPGKAFKDLGFDSLTAVELRNRLVAASGLRLPATSVFDYPNPLALARFLLAEATTGAAQQVVLGAQATDEPIAIVGMACRYPGGVASPRELWSMIAEGGDGIAGFPADRGWDLERLYDPDPDTPRTSYTREGGFLADPGQFDAEFFGLSPREALATDPQQRLLLESSWEALEAAGIDPSSLRGEQAGVFAGIMHHDYGAGAAPPVELEGYFGTGISASVASGRIAYTLGLEGPAVTVDTACSSSLVAIHLAAQALRGGECTLALAGGATVMATPGLAVEFSRQRGLASDGRCKPFSEAADGIGISEGVGVVILARLSDAERRGLPVLATIRGSAVNQDGASNGLTAPNGPSQERVIRQALANARLSPKDVDMVEAHGTGTMLGDPIEAGALLATYGQEREQPLYLGSIKSNIGHTQAAAGVAGVIKAVMAMREGVLPKSLHIDAPSSKVEWETGQIELLSEERPWEQGGGPRRAAVSSFGISGTNAHLVLEGPPEAKSPEREGEGSEPPAIPIAISAKSERALGEQAERLRSHIEANPDLDPTDLAYSLATTRTAFEHRAVAVGKEREELLQALAALCRGREAKGLVRGIARAEQAPVFLFAGQGAQHAGMALELLESSPAFAERIGQCERALSPFVDWSLEEVLRDEEGRWLDSLAVVQPALFAVMVSLAGLWRESGVRPAAVLGHSQGEIAAAHVAGALSLEDAARVIALRAKAMAKIAGKGGMLSVSLAPRQLRERIEPYADRLALAAINGPASLIVSGEPAALDELLASCERDDVRAQRIAVDYAAHSAQIEALEAELLEAFAPISPRSSEIPFHSTLTGEEIDTAELGPSYWYRNLRQTVLFEPALRSLLSQGKRDFIEIGPHPVLSFGATETIEDVLGEPEQAAVVETLRRGEQGPQRFCLSLARAHAQGMAIDWDAFFEGTGARQVPLPTYPFQRKRYWLESSVGRADAISIGQGDPEHPLLGAIVEDPAGGGLTLTTRLSSQSHPWLADHAVADAVLLPATAFLEMALLAAERLDCQSVEELTIAAPVVFSGRDAVALQVTVSDSDEEGLRELQIHSRPETPEAQWTLNATGSLSPESLLAPEPLPAWPPEGAEQIETDHLYDRLAEAGFEYGPGFQGLERAWRSGDEVYAQASLPAELASGAERFCLHPALADAALHAIFLAAGSAEPRLPFSWSGVCLRSHGAEGLRVVLRPKGDEQVCASLYEPDGEPLATIQSLSLRPVDPDRLKGRGKGGGGLLEIEWRELDPLEPMPHVERVSQLSELLEAETEGEEAPALILWEPARGRDDDPAKAALELSERVLGELQAWLEQERFIGTRLAVLTQGAVATAEGDSPDLPAACLWGLLRSAQSEHPERLVLLDTDGSEASGEAIAAALSLTEEPQLALREGSVLAPKAVPCGDAAAEPTPLDPEKTVLITGAPGGLGSLVARHLIEAHGARRLLLASRSGPGAEGATELKQELEQLGAEVAISACDVSDRDQLQKLLDQIDDSHPLGAVIHAAGVLEDAVFASLDGAQLRRVFAPKVDAAWGLHELTKDMELSAFVCFSSVAGVLGSPGQANYAAANSFCDALAQHRRALGLPANSIAWGFWQRESGLTAHLGEAELGRMARFGIAPLTDEQGLELFDRALAGSPALSLGISLRREALRSLARAGALPPLLGSLIRTPTRRRVGGSEFSQRLAGMSAQEREGFVLELVRAEVASVLGHASPAAIDPQRAFKDLGFDSLAAVELRNRLAAASGVRLTPAVVFDHPNARRLAEHLTREASMGARGKLVATRAQASDEPIAILGMACRYPGEVATPEELWRLVAAGGEGIGEFPVDRGWDQERLYHSDPDHAGTTYSTKGGFLAEAGHFDAEFFGIAPREALAMDPQQRLLLESSWEALEAAGIDPSSLRGEQAGVFAGLMHPDYASGSTLPAELEGYFGTGISASVASGRIAYTLGLEGPAVTVDTACSSSLVAIHLASQALRQGECDLALAGGATVLATPSLFVDFARQRGLAPDGRCKSFSETADGTGFSEGVGIVVLARLSEAERNGHPILATIRGSAVNQDGASNGLTAPNGPSQERVIRQALANARLTPQDVEMVEAHGTGTMLGDPIEAGALLATYGQEREAPLYLGSIKSNIGHTQAAAGVAGVIKAVMAMREGTMPRSLHSDRPSSKVDWEAGKIELLGEERAWEQNGGPRRAAVSSFGVSGTNAHMILEGAPETGGGEEDPGAGSGAPSKEARALPELALPLSAKSERALAEQADRLRSHLESNPDLEPADVAHSLATTRACLEHRAVVIGSEREQLLAALSCLARGEGAENLARGIARAEQAPVFLFAGQGGQHAQMALELLEASPAFARHMDACEAALSPYMEVSLGEILREEEGRWLERIELVQPALFAVSVSLARLLQEFGVRPAAVVGHSQGEIAAAHVAGALSLEDAARLSALRSKLIADLAGQGGLVSVALGAEELEPRLERWRGRVEVAAFNGPSSTILSGDREALDELLESCEQEGTRARVVPAAVASHSAYVEPLRERLLEALAPIEPRSAEIPFHSTVSGEQIDTAELDPEYWYRNMRQPVLFEPVVRGLLGQGHRLFLEVGPHPVFVLAVGETIEQTLEEPSHAHVLGTLRRDRGGPERFALSLAEAHVHGAPVRWDALCEGTGAKRVPLPTYPFQRKRYWLESTMGGSDPLSLGQTSAEHPLLGAVIEDTEGEGLAFTGRLSLQTHPWLADHALGGTVLLPGTAFVELALKAAEEVGARGIEELTIEAPLLIPEQGAIALRVAVGEADDEGRREISVHSRPGAAEAEHWTRNAGGFLWDEATEAGLPLEAWPPEGAEPLEVEFLYDRFAEAGFDYGPCFQGLTAAWRLGEEIYAEVRLDEERSRSAADFLLHPALSDAALHAVALAVDSDATPRLPFSWGGVSLALAGASEVRVRLGRTGSEAISLALFDQAGAPLAKVDSLALRPVDPARLRAPGDGDGSGALLGLEWERLGLGEAVSFDEVDRPAAHAGAGELPGVVLWHPQPSQAGGDCPDRARAFAEQVLEQVQGWLAEDRFADVRLAILTDGGLAVEAGGPPQLCAATALGLLRSAQSEHPGRFVLIDTDGSDSSQAAIGAALGLVEEPQIALRDGVALAPRLSGVPAQAGGGAAEPEPVFDPERTVLLTGATGGLGSLVARHLVTAHGARHLLLVSRSGPEAERAGELLAELKGLGAQAQIVACDVSDRDQLQALLAGISAEHPLGAVVHAAGALEDATIETLSAERFGPVFAPKVDAAWHLHELTREMGISAFVLFSSAAGVLGSPGQGNYAAANSFLDALAQERRAEGLPATAIAWGLWDRESEMGAHLGEAGRARITRSGVAGLSDAQGLALFDQALSNGQAWGVAIRLDRAGLRERALAGALPAVLSNLVRIPARRRAAARTSLGAKLATLPAGERKAFVLDLVRTEIASLLGHGSPAEIDPERAFKDLGFDSLAAVELRNRLSAATGVRLAPAVVFDHPTPGRLAEHLEAQASASAPSRSVATRAQASEEPIAILGMACRFPGGVATPEELWRLVAEGGDGIAGFPTDRGWDLERLYDPDPDTPRTSYAREGGFLADPGHFDADFFGLSPREALATDPQQRLLLEAAWEALEEAGIDPSSLRGEQAGVFAGIMHHDYGGGSIPPPELEGYVGTGVSASVASGRIAYTLGIEGPAVTVDTACSSSLVAMHLAAQALRQGECTLALAGGASVMATPGLAIDFARQRGLAPDGRCKPFAEGADGIGASEGTGVLVLARLSDAEREGHPILATIRGSAVNQDGASNGLTAPNGPSQERVIRQALANARLTPQDVEMVEAHGTGTMLGDPIEAGALLATYGQEREQPLYLGSIKSNIGHTQAAAGVAGVIKAVMAMREGVLPKSLHIDKPSTKVDWEAGKIELLSERRPWEANGGPRRAAVSSFGVSGTNAHMILEGAPEAGRGEEDSGAGSGAPSEEPRALPVLALPLSAKSERALAEQADRLRSRLQENPQHEPADVAYSLATTRASLEHRAVVIAEGREGLLDSLAALAGEEPSPETSQARAKTGRLAYLLTGQGSQRVGMGKELYEAYPAYREALDELLGEIDPHLDRPLAELLFAEPGSEQAKLLDHTTYAQPALFATEVALARLLGSLGLRPELLAGHSVGEIAAAHIAGVFDLADAARLIAARGALMGELPTGGAMAAIEATEQELREAIEGREGELSLAAVNGPTSVVLSGEEKAIEELVASFAEQGAKTKRLEVSHAFHSPLMEPMLAPFAELARTLTYNEPKIPIASNTSGAMLSPAEATDPAYWVAHVREPVRFADAVGALREQGAIAFVELGPDPVLSAIAAECLGEEAGELAFAAALREGRSEPETLTAAIAAAYASGVKVDWQAFFKDTGAKRIALPTYPFQRKRFWLASGFGGAGDVSGAGLTDPEHPLLGAVIEDPQGEGLALTASLSLATHPWLADHAVSGAVLLPGTAFLELALNAARRLGAKQVGELTLQAPLAFSESTAMQLQVSVASPDEEGRRELRIHSRPRLSGEEGEEGEWTLNAEGALLAEPLPLPEPPQSWPPAEAEPLDFTDVYERLGEVGLEYGPAFRGLSAAWRVGETICAEASLAEGQASEASRYAIHPALLDSALHGIGLVGGEGAAASPKLPFAFAGVSVQGEGAAALRVRIEPSEEGASISLFDATGAPLAQISTLALRDLDPEQLKLALRREEGLLGVEWNEIALPAGSADSPPAELWRPEPAAGADPAEAARAAAQAALARIQGFLSRDPAAEEPLAILTAGAVAAGEGESPDLAASSVWGLVRSAQSEHPGRILLLDSDGSEASEGAIEGAIAASIANGEPQLALREGVALVPRVARAQGEGPEAPAIDPERTVLLTGATGGLGSLVARHLVTAHGARHLLLVSRSGPEAERAGELLAELQGLGAQAQIVACDVSDRDQLQALLAGISAEHPLGAVLHTAGTVSDATIETLSAERFGPVFAPKADGAWHLHELTREMDLSAFLLFSSAAGTFGSPGQGNYAAANSFLDALAHQRRAQGLPATAIAWGLWDRESQMTSVLSEADKARLARSGIGALTEEQGLALLDEALASELPQVLGLRLERPGLRAQARAGVLVPLLRGLIRVPQGRRGQGGELARKLLTLAAEEREAFVLDAVRAEVAAVLGHASAAAIDPERAFKDLGFDSLAAVELRNRLSAASGLRLPATAVFDYPNAQKLAQYLLGEASASAPSRSVATRAQASEEPIAILGMACRYPGGVATPEELWRLVAEGGDGIAGFPTDRGWDLERLYDPDPDTPRTSYAREGGFLADPGHFDADFFGLSPREALATDPQQRLLLESSWEALKSSGIDPSSLRGEQAGVFAGVMHHDYATGSNPPPELEGYFGTGISASVASGRIAYTLGIEGPAVTVDTACSSSLVTMHLAAQALRQGECSLAIAGGVTVVATPTLFTEFSRQRGLAPDGRSKPFAEAADGVGWSEGVGIVVLARLSDAEREGHPILATIRGSAVNQDGASNGLTAPNGPSQERVIRQALANARLTPKDIDMVEAHGTGTMLGDPIEAGALLATYGQEREQPLYLGSIKSNIGHTQAAAGVAGVIKAVMAMREGVLPKSLHIDKPSTKVDWEAGKIELLSEERPWEANGRPRRAAVSSFGISGTNAHLVLEGAPEAAGAEDLEGPTEGSPSESPSLPAAPIVLSARNEEALAEQASRLVAHLGSNPHLSLADVAYSLATTRTPFEHRTVAVGNERGELLVALAAIAEGKQPPSASQARAKTGRLAYLLTGQGSQRVGMGKELYEAYPAYREALDELLGEIDPHLDRPLAELLFAEPDSEQAKLLDHTTYAQPALFATEVALARLLGSLGLRPELLAGHSVGEIAAAHIAGVFDLADAARLIAARGALMGELPTGGAMAAIEATEQELREAIEGREGELSLAAVNGPTSVVLSGEEKAIEELVASFAEQGAKTKRLEVSHAFHSPLMEPMLAPFAELARTLTYNEPKIPIASNTSGAMLSPAEATDPAYWVAHVREPVRFADAVGALREQGAIAFVELGPDPVLSAIAAECLGEEAGELAFAAALREGRSEPETLTAAIAAAHASGVKVDWQAFFKDTGAKRIALPTYPFQRKRFWLASGFGGAGDVSGAGLTDPEHPLLGAVIEDPQGEGLALTASLSLATHPWLADHAVSGAVLLPGTAFLELALNAARRLGAKQVGELTLQAPLAFSESTAMQLQVSVASPDEEGRRELRIHSRPRLSGEEGEEGEWTLNAEGALLAEPLPLPEPPQSWPPAEAEPLDFTDVYERLGEVGLEYGPAFRGLSAAWRVGETICAEASLAEGQASEASRYAIHPALLDSALHGIGLVGGEGAAASPKLPFAFAGVSVQGEGAAALRVRIEPSEEGASISLFDATGAPLAQISTLALRDLDPEQLKLALRREEGLLGVEWNEIALPAGSADSPPAELWRPEPAAGADPAEAARAAAQAALARIQGFLSRDPAAEEPLAILTAGAVAAGEGESPDLAASSVWGLVRSAQSEHPGRILLLDSDGSEASEGAIEGAIAASIANGEPQLALREGVALVPRVARAQGEGPEAPAIDPERTVLLTGATGGLGSLVARHLVTAHGARHLLLVSRSGPEAERAGELLAELQGLGAQAQIVACDVSDRDQLQALLAGISAEHPLGAVLHTAGTVSDATIETLSAERFGPVFAPKADGAWHLHELTREMGLSAFLLFSSAAGTFGSPGQGNYAAANSFLDALAHQRRAQGLPATAIAWGLWDRESQMTSVLSEADKARLARSGIGALTEEQGLALLDEALASELPQVLGLRLERPGLRAQARAGVLVPLLRGLIRVPQGRRGQGGELARKLLTLAAEEREAFVLDAVRAEVAAVLGHASAAAIDPERAFKDLGFDSLAAVELRNRLSAASGLRLPATAVFDYPNAQKLAEYLLGELDQGEKATALAQLEHLELALASVSSEDPGRLKLATRLRALASSLESEMQTEDTLDRDRLESASDEELLEFIDEQVGGAERDGG